MTRSNQLYGMLLMASAMLLVPALDVISKLLMARLSPLEVTAARFLAQTLVLLPLVLRPQQISRPGPGQALAGLLLGMTLLSFNFAIREMPIANALAIFFVEPLLLTLLAALLLREELGLRRLVAVLVGLAGALLVLRPNVAAYGATALLPLATALFFSCYMLTTRVMSQRGSPLLLQFWTGVFAALTLLLALAFTSSQSLNPTHYSDLTWRDGALVLALGLVAAVGHQLIVRALALVEAGVLAPFQYLELVSATLLGWLVFGNFPDGMTWVGTAVIVAAGLYVFRFAVKKQS